MTEPIPLPDNLRASGFRVADARALGMSKHRLYGDEFCRPFRGVRAAHESQDLLARCGALAPVLDSDQALSGIAALRVWGLRVPSRLSDPTHPIEILEKKSGAHMARAGTRSRRIRDDLFAREVVEGLPVLPPILAVLTAARHLRHDEITVLLDALLASSKLYPGIRLPQRPYLQPRQLLPTFLAYRGMQGLPAIRIAAERARPGVESPMETVTRLLLVDAGLPEPVIQPKIRLRNGDEYRPDLGYPFVNAFVDYDGEHHWRDRATFDNDLARSRAFVDAGISLYRITSADLHGQRFWDLVGSLRNHLGRAA